MAKRQTSAAPADDQVEVDLTLAEYNETYLTCRDLMHAWRVYGYYRDGGWSGTTKRLINCERCGMERTDAWDGITVRHRYDPPDGYRIEGVHLSKADVRAEQLRRASRIFDSKEEMKKALKRRKSAANVRSIHSAVRRSA